ncbi:DNA/RNA helicase domain-containing protein [Persicobacter sp. CCB-QB2]|uniref:DNA/RNA helicase domain-containing protein n=1 Tax=Persicobacter sp. CCB-QB2 TaxID=1561025 RepID=UPI0006A9C9F0|nr:DNA/RNA helicase domain-containing protein [Persicobacter sp. CCB-QB2]
MSIPKKYIDALKNAKDETERMIILASMEENINESAIAGMPEKHSGKCESATGPKCECKCGGKFHGAGLGNAVTCICGCECEDHKGSSIKAEQYRQITQNKEAQPTNHKQENGFSGFGSLERTEDPTPKIKIPGQIGLWLGEFAPHESAIVLRGDKGAGKTRLAFQLMNGLASLGKSVGFFTLEMDPAHPVIRNYTEQYIHPENRSKIQSAAEAAKGVTSLHEAAQHFDVVVVDSWNKVPNAKQQDLNDLRKQHKQTIFIMIFQSTTGRQTRGGNMVEFDSDMVIHVHEGGRAMFEKNRYSNADRVFNVFEERIEGGEDVEVVVR